MLGGGTAGFMASAYLSHRFREFELLHVFDPTKPPIGVGEGTTPGFYSWVRDLAPTALDAMREACDATVKRGVRFEHWGRVHPVFDHDFVPSSRGGLHISASGLINFLGEYSTATRIPHHVLRLRRQTNGVTLHCAGGSKVVVDLVIDARGFPTSLDGRRHHRLTWIPTDAALVTRGPVVTGLERTRAVARPHGWVFVIPLCRYTSYGYVFGSKTATREAVSDDFTQLLRSEGVPSPPTFRHIRFPNYVCRTVFDGAVFKMGNAASFIEPLEATSIAVIRYQLRYLTGWLELSASPTMAERLVAGVNRECVDLVLETSVFLGWHYAGGSSYDTPFWQTAERRFWEAMKDGIPDRVRSAFNAQLRCAQGIPPDLVRATASARDVDGLVGRFGPFPAPFGGMTPLGFTQVASGIGVSTPG